jgi:6-phosphogluconolactonase
MTNPRDTSRRDFLAAAALGIVSLGSGAKSLSGEGSTVDGELLYVGTYTDDGRSKGIYLVRIDPRTGELNLVGSCEAGPNPSFLAVHPDGRVLYGVNEVDKFNGKASGGVSAFAIAPDTGALRALGSQLSDGTGPCYVSVDNTGRAVLVANYDSGTVALLPITANDSLGSATSVAQHAGSGPISDSQKEPHAHCIVADPSNRFALAADLGADRVFVYRLDLDGKSLHRVAGGEAVMHPGSGPRHLAFHPSLPLVFVANELGSSISTLQFHAERGALSLIATQPTVPRGWAGKNYPADIHITPSGRVLYVSNRGHNSIAIFSIDSTGALSLGKTVPCGGDWPRNFSLDPTGQWLLVANQKSDSIVVFARDPENGKLTPTGQRLSLPNPVCLRFRSIR